MQKQRLNIGLVAFAWGPNDKGGLMTHVRGIAESLTSIGHRVFVHCVDTRGSNIPFETKGWVEGSIHIQEMNYRYEDAKSLIDFQRVPQAEIILEHWARHYDLDLIDFHHNLFFGTRAIEILSKMLPVAATLHDYWPVDPRGQLFSSDGKNINPDDNQAWEESLLSTWPQQIHQSLDALEYFNQAKQLESQSKIKSLTLKQAWAKYSDKCLKFASAIITPSSEAAEILRKHGITCKIQVIENGLDTSVFQKILQTRKQINSVAPSSFSKKTMLSITNKHTDDLSKIKISILGTIAPHKGQLAFTKACLDKRICDRICIQLFGPLPDSYHGDEKSQNYLKKLAIENPGFLQIKGSYERSELTEIFDQSDIVAMPSIWQEVYGFIAREALAYGLPVITTNAGGLNSLQRQNGVFLLPVEEINEWANLLSNALEKGPICQWVTQRREGIPVTNKPFKSVDTCASELSMLYQQLVHHQQVKNLG